MSKIEVCLNGKDWVEVNKQCVDYIYEDEKPALFIVIDELANLTQSSKALTEDQKIENQKKGEILSMMRSIAELGRASNIFLITATQKPTIEIVPSVLRDNLGFRAFCGKGTSGASKATFDDFSKATLIDDTYKGMAIVQSGGDAFTRVYFSDFSDLEDYYKKRGLDPKGYSTVDLGELEENIELSGTEELTISSQEEIIELDNDKAVFDQRRDQKWEEV